MIKNLKSKKGFTLTELIVVIVIIGILAVVLIPTLTGYIKKANESADDQEVAALNKLLYDAKIQEVEFVSVNQLKEYLETEMGYNNDYSLRVKGNYIWYDTKNYQFEIIGEEDNESLKAASEPVYVALSIKSPEGLLQYEDGSELWLVGGNGYLVDVVEEIRNVGNTGNNLKQFSNIKNSDITNAYKAFFDNYKFVGTKGEFIINADGTVSEATGSSRDSVYSDYSSEMVPLFHNEVVLPNITKIQNKLLGTGVSLEIVNGYDVEIIISDGADISETATAVLELIKLLKSEGCTLGYVIPKQYNNTADYKVVLNTIMSEYNKNSSKVSAAVKAFLSDDSNVELIKNIENLYTINLRKLDLSSDLAAVNSLMSDVLPVLITSLCLYENNGVYDSYDFAINGPDTFLNKNDITVIGVLDSAAYGNIEVKYNFKFVDNRTK